MHSKGFLLCWCLLLFAFGDAKKQHSKQEERVIYGTDNRHEPFYFSSNEKITKLARSDAAILFTDQISYDEPDRTWKIFDYSSFDSVLDGCDLCSDERFYGEPLISTCSGFLVDTNKIATAGHCVDDGECSDYAIIFDLKVVNSDGDINLDAIPDDNVYFCQDTMHVLDDNEDWGIILLDRHVVGRSPVPTKFSDMSVDSSLIMIGHPWGLPMKVDDGGKVKEFNSGRSVTKFEASTDSYAGNSGSMVIDAASYKAVGILVSGNEDFVHDDAAGCCRSNICSEKTGCDGVFESVTKLSIVPDWFGWYPAVSISSQNIIEEGAGYVNLNISLDAVCGDDVTVDLYTSDGTATADDDYEPIDTTVTINAGDIYTLVQLNIYDDDDDELDETIIVTLDNPYKATLGLPGTESKTIKIRDDDTPEASVDGPDEVDESDGTVEVAIELDRPPAQEVRVKYKTVAGTAKSGSDYTTISGTAVFQAGETLVLLDIPIKQDSLDENDEYFLFTIYDPENAVLGYSEEPINIIDDDPLPIVQISPASLTRTELSEKATVTVFLNQPSGRTVTIYLASGTNGTSEDFSVSEYTLEFAPGETSKTTIVSIVPDSVTPEDPELISVFFDGMNNANPGYNTGVDIIVLDSPPKAACGTTCSFSSTGCSITSTADITLDNNVYGASFTSTSCGSSDFSADEPDQSQTIVTINAFDTNGDKIPYFRFRRENPLVVKFPIPAERPGWQLLMNQDGETLWSDATSTCGLQPIVDDIYITFFICHLTTFSLVSTQGDRDALLEWSFVFFCGDFANPTVSGSFTEIYGLQNSNEWECDPFTESNGREVTSCLPSQIVSSPVVAKRGLSYDDQFWNWRDLVANGDLAAARQNCTVLVYDRGYLAARQFTLFNAWPTSVAIETLATNPEIPGINQPGEVAAMEVITIVHEGFINGAAPTFFEILPPN